MRQEVRVHTCHVHVVGGGGRTCLLSRANTARIHSLLLLFLVSILGVSQAWGPRGRGLRCGFLSQKRKGVRVGFLEEVTFPAGDTKPKVE